MKKLFKYVFMVPLVFLVVCGLTTPVWAIPITMQFTATGFLDASDTSISAPHDPVIGTIVWDAASVNSTINSLSSISLAIDSHTYLFSEVGFWSPFNANVDLIGGLSSGQGATAGFDDFWIRWDRISLTPVDFLYTSSTTPTTGWETHNFTSFSITADAAPIPEPATVLLLGTGLVGLVGFRKKFKK